MAGIASHAGLCDSDSVPLAQAARNGEFDKLRGLVERGAPVNFKHVSRKPKLRAYPLSVAVFRNRTEIVEFLLARGADPLLRNYRKETCFDIARQAGLTEMLALLERWRGRAVAADAETDKNRERDIKNVRRLEMDERPDISRAEIAANVKQSSAFDAQIRAREEEALRRKEAAIRERKERERRERDEEERVYLASLAGAGENERARAAALEAREAARRAHAAQREAWEAERRREEEEGAAALAELQRRREAAQRGRGEQEEEERRAREQFEAREREAVQRALQLKAKEKEPSREKAKEQSKAPRAALSADDEWAALAAAVEANIETHEGSEEEAPPPAALPPPPPAWDSGEEEEVEGDEEKAAEEAAARFLAEKQKKKAAEQEKARREDAERKKKEDAEKTRKEEAEKTRKEVAERRKREEEADEARREAERKKRAEAERAKAEAPAAANVARSKFAYKAAREDELSFKKGESITIVSLDPKGKWHLGRLESGATGRFPANYI